MAVWHWVCIILFNHFLFLLVFFIFLLTLLFYFVITLGFDRLIAIMCGTDSIRDVIAFPKAAGGKDFVVASPSSITEGQMSEYGLKLIL